MSYNILILLEYNNGMIRALRKDGTSRKGLKDQQGGDDKIPVQTLSNTDSSDVE
jgi:hypothetical protein